jgi:NADH:ubiquinone oxidoreductase subunit E
VTEDKVEAGRLDERLQPILEAYHSDPLQLVQILRATQEAIGYLPATALTAIAPVSTLFSI